MMSAVQKETEQTQCLTFYIAGEEYAVNILRVKEIIGYDTLTKVPIAPAYIRGVINLRGSVVPVADLAVKFGLPERPITNRTCIVIVELEVDGEQTLMGLLADAVNRVIELLPQDIEVPPGFGTRVSSGYLLGMGKNGNKFFLILDTDRVLSSDELFAPSQGQAALQRGEQGVGTVANSADV